MPGLLNYFDLAISVLEDLSTLPIHQEALKALCCYVPHYLNLKVSNYVIVKILPEAFDATGRKCFTC
jgi:hypothetical protein